MIQVKSLCKDFGAYRAVDEVSFNLEKGEVLGFLGPNGAGKSTTMKMLTCFLRPTSGTAVVGGHDILKAPLEVRKLIGYLPESAPSYQEMLVEEFLKFAGEVRGYTGKELQKRVDHVLEITALQDVRYQMIDTLSKGYRQRTCLAQALLHEPPVLILDEPTDGLDPNQKHEVRTLIKQMSEQRAILVSTHILEEVETVCTRALIIANGKLVADGSPENLLARSSYHNAISLTVIQGNTEQLLAGLKQVEGVESVAVLEEENKEDVSLQIFAKSGQSIHHQVEDYIRTQKLSVAQLFVERGRLDEVFRKLTLGTAQ
ncbi:ATP-binding cassette domain-containing protein [Deltaproteobacteria bacterium TL4]